MFGVDSDLKNLEAFEWERVSADPSWRRDMLATYFFFEVLLKKEDQNGWTFTGCSFSQRGLNTLLCVKAEREGTQLVAFITEKFPTGCVVTFGRQWLQDRVNWYPDKYPRT